jgi:plasmid stabilization system protein ParE
VKVRASYHRLAEGEFAEAAGYYDQKSPGLGGAFVREIEACVASILEQPRAGRQLRGDVRRRLVHRFPYAVVYRIIDGGIRILAVMNLRRRPSYWAGRS